MIEQKWSMGPRRLLSVGTAAVAVAAIAGCGGSGSSASSSMGGDSPGSSASLPKLTMAIGAASPTYADLFIAQAEGFYKRAGVDVSIQNAGTDFVSPFLSGRADLMTLAPASSFPYVAKGKDIKLIYATNFGTSNGFVVKADSSITGPLGLSGAKIATYGVGESMGDAVALSNYIVQHGGKPLNILTLASSTGAQGPMVVAGTVDTTLQPPSAVLSSIQAHKLRWAPGLAPGSQLMRQFVPPNSLGTGGFMATAETIQSKRTAIVRFIAAVRAADKWLASHSDSQAASALTEMPAFSGQSESEILSAVKTSRPAWAIAQQGYISEARWNASLPVWNQWKVGVPNLPSSPQFSYASRADMSLWNDATNLAEKL